jgi:hypothetical protein
MSREVQHDLANLLVLVVEASEERLEEFAVGDVEGRALVSEHAGEEPHHVSAHLYRELDEATQPNAIHSRTLPRLCMVRAFDLL